MSYNETARARVVKHPIHGRVLVASFPQHDDVVRELKRWLHNPFARMHWDTCNNVWFFDGSYIVLALNILDEFFDKLVYPDHSLLSDFSSTVCKPAPADAYLLEDPWEVMGLRPDVDPDVARVVYRALARKWHPDCGGSDVMMQRLNSAWEKIQAKFDTKEPTVAENDDPVGTEGCEY
jgi:hypothetical protein